MQTIQPTTNLLDALTSWRKAVAAEWGCSPAKVVSDKALKAIAANPPHNEFDLLDRGMKPREAARWMDDILAIVKSA